MDSRFEELLIQYAQADTKILQEEIERMLWTEFGTVRSVLVMDMSGFSRLTQKYGIVHYLSMVKRMQVTSQPIIEHLGDVYFKKKMYEKSLEKYEKALTLNHPQADKVKEKIQQLKRLLKQTHPESKRSTKAL